MPIYGDKLLRNQTKLTIKIDVKTFNKLVSIFKKAINTFSYRDNIEFLKTIELDEVARSVRYVGKINQIYDKEYIDKNTKNKIPFIAKYKNKDIDDYHYIMYLESLIKKANTLIPVELNKYILDITGSWTDGKIIVLEKK